ncbi:MAG TPA: Uma2 family endonuclease [Blastocatellia bacterium]|nr:Uma2 family endonuclease [Blastocatellia bacterium]
MIAEATKYYTIVSQLPEDTEVIFHGATWEDYEELLDQVGEAAGLRISFNDGTLKVMSLSSEHEKYVRFIEGLIVAIKLRLRINIVSFGSTTMRKRRKSKGNEPDACFYVQTAAVIGNRIELDFSIDPPPDIVLEVDIHHDSTNNDAIYAALGAPEIWRYDGCAMTIYHLQEGEYVVAEASRALSMLNGEILTEHMNRMLRDGEFEALLAFDGWLQSLPR